MLLRSFLIFVIATTCSACGDVESAGDLEPGVAGAPMPENQLVGDAAARPLVVVALHGYGHTAADALTQTGIPGAAQWSTVITPEGQQDSVGNYYWNATAACCDFDHRGNDDVTPIANLIAVARDAAPDARVLVIGQSNGGFLAEAIAREHPELVDVVIDISGAGDGSLPPSSVRFIRAHGTGDTTIYYTGGTMPHAGMSPYPAATDGCADWTPTGERDDYDIAIDGAETVVSEGCGATLLTMNHSPHQPRLDAAWENAVRGWLQ